MIIGTYKQFLKNFFIEFEKTNIDLSELELDHLGYQASSSQDYENQKKELLDISVLVKETVLDDRRISIFVLNDVLKYRNYEIDIIELIEPKNEYNQNISEWDHVEFILDKGIESFMKKYPSLPWDISVLNRDVFPMLKLKVNGIKVKFPKVGLKEQIAGVESKL